METTISYCGLKCITCQIHLATLENNKKLQESMRKSIAEQCSNIYGMHLQSSDITDCDGCQTASGRLFQGCQNCEIRKCATQNAVENCAHCLDFPCEKLKQHFSLDHEAQERLDKIRHTFK